MSITVGKATRKTNKKQLSMAQEKILAMCLEFEKQTMKAHENTGLLLPNLIQSIEIF